MSYLVRFRKAEDITGDYISMAVAGDTTTVVLPHLFPVTAYEVNVFAQYDKGDSFPLTGEETTLEGKRDLLGPNAVLVIKMNVESNIFSHFQNKGLYETYKFQRRQPTVSGCHGKLLQDQ